MIAVQLSPQEISLAAQVGVRRQLSAILKGLKDRHGCDPGNGWQVHVEGACGELAVAKALGLYWGGSVDTFRSEADVGVYEVRTRSEHYYELIVRDDDDTEKRYILVTGRNGDYRVHGWMRGIDACVPEWRKTHGNREPAYFVPQSALRSPLELQFQRPALVIRAA